MPKPLKKAKKTKVKAKAPVKSRGTSRPTAVPTRPRSQKEAWDYLAKVYKAKPSSDPVSRARQLLDEYMAKAGEAPIPKAKSYLVNATIGPGEIKIGEVTPISQAQLSAHMSRLGAKGGKVSGAKRTENLTPEQRQEIASKAATARWRQAKASQKNVNKQ